MTAQDRATVEWARWALKQARRARLQAEAAAQRGELAVAGTFNEIAAFNWESARRTLAGVLVARRALGEQR